MSDEVTENQNDVADPVVEDKPLEEELYGEEESERSEGDKSEGETTEEDKQEEKQEAEGEEAKEAKEESADPKEVAYELKLPEDSKLDATLVDKIESIAKTRGLSNEDAQGLLDEQVQLADSYNEQMQSDYKKTVEQWESEFKSDPDYGGQNLEKSQALEAKALKRYASEDLAKYLEDSQLGKSAEFRKMMVRIGKDLSDDSFEKGKDKPLRDKPLEDVFYGNS